MAEYALITAMVATLALSLATIPQSELDRRLPVTAARAQSLVSKSARASHLPPAQARAVMARAPYGRAPLRYLYAEGWMRGTRDPRSCVFAKAAPSATSRNVAAAIQRDPKLVTRLRRMKVAVDQAAEAVFRGTAAAC